MQTSSLLPSPFPVLPSPTKAPPPDLPCHAQVCQTPPPLFRQNRNPPRQTILRETDLHDADFVFRAAVTLINAYG